MPVPRLASRPRTSSRPPPVFARKPILNQVDVSLADMNEWEPSSDEPVLSLEEVREAIREWEEDLVQKGKLVSGRTM